jgi:hypothetical protein
MALEREFVRNSGTPTRSLSPPDASYHLEVSAPAEKNLGFDKILEYLPLRNAVERQVRPCSQMQIIP